MHSTHIRVYYEDTDAGGVVYYANYLKFAERARTEYLRALGLEQARLRKENGILFAVRRASLDLRRPARLDDLLEVVTEIQSVSGASLEMRQRITRIAATGDHIEIIALLDIHIACIGVDFRPARLPAPVRAVFEAESESRQ